MSKRELAISLGVGLSTVESAIRDGSLEAVKIRQRGQSSSPEARERYLASRPRIKPTNLILSPSRNRPEALAARSPIASQR